MSLGLESTQLDEIENGLKSTGYRVMGYAKWDNHSESTLWVNTQGHQLIVHEYPRSSGLELFVPTDLRDFENLTGGKQ